MLPKDPAKIESYRQKLRDKKLGTIPYNKGKKGVSEETHNKMVLARNDGRVTGIYTRTAETRIKNSIGNKDKKRTEEQRKHISEGHIGMIYTEERNLRVSIGVKNYVKTEEHCKHIRESKIGIPQTEESNRKRSESESGAKHHNWQGGKSFEPYGLEFNDELREQIRTRDNHQCQECFKFQRDLRTKKGKEYLLMIHHIDYNKRNNNSDNLITLCRICHAKTNYRRKDWEEYFKVRLWIKEVARDQSCSHRSESCSDHE